MENKKLIKPQTLKGFRDFLPDYMQIRERVVTTLKEVFSSYGFDPLETPALEYAETLLGKYGEEADKLIYQFKDRGDREVGLRYDLTVPLARVISSYPNLSIPFKRYQIQPVWRADKPQKGRYREFIQCDIDIVGSPSDLADAEIIAVIYTALSKLKVGTFRILINTRPLLYSVMEQAGIPKNKWKEVAITIDKIDKINSGDLEKELVEKRAVAKGCVEELFRISSLLKKEIPDATLLSEGNVLKMKFDIVNKQLAPLKNIAMYANFLGVPKEILIPRFTLARGLDYYTGAIFETIVTKPKIGAITGGGRYDELIKQLGGPDLPAVGTTIGLDRVVDVITELNLWPGISSTSAQVLVTIFSFELRTQAIETTKLLRNRGINAELYLDEYTKLDKQLKYANQKGIPYVIILGPEEVSNNKVTVKNMETGEQKTVNKEELISHVP